MVKVCPIYSGYCRDECGLKDEETGECAILTLAKEQKKANLIAQKAFCIKLDNTPTNPGNQNRVKGVAEKIE